MLVLKIPEDEIIVLLQRMLSKKRFLHSVAVSKSAVGLAKIYGADQKKAYIAGLTHDVCKDISKEKQLQMADEFAIILTESERLCPKLWHAIVGSEYIKRYICDDAEIVSAVRYHTTAKADMKLLDKIIYVADCVSSDRDFPGVEEFRQLSRESLDEVIFKMCRVVLSELLDEGFPLHPDTLSAYNQLCVNKLEVLYGTETCFDQTK